MFIRMNNKNEKGFTLIELLITIAIVGTLAAIAIPLYISQQSKAYQTTAISDGRAWADNINSVLSTATDLGTSGTITLGTVSNGQATITITLTGTPVGVTSPVTTTVAVSTGDVTGTIGSTGSGTTAYCYIVDNNGGYAAFNQNGYQPDKSTSSETCTGGVLS